MNIILVFMLLCVSVFTTASECTKIIESSIKEFKQKNYGQPVGLYDDQINGPSFSTSIGIGSRSSYYLSGKGLINKQNQSQLKLSAYKGRVFNKTIDHEFELLLEKENLKTQTFKIKVIKNGGVLSKMIKFKSTGDNCLIESISYNSSHYPDFPNMKFGLNNNSCIKLKENSNRSMIRLLLELSNTDKLLQQDHLYRIKDNENTPSEIKMSVLSYIMSTCKDIGVIINPEWQGASESSQSSGN